MLPNDSIKHGIERFELQKGEQMNATLKYLSVLGVVLALVLAVGITAGRSVHRGDLGTTRVETANSVRELGDTNKQTASKPTSNFSYQPGCKNTVMPCDQVSCLENITCPLNATKTEKEARK